MFYRDSVTLIIVTARTHAKVWFYEVNKMTGKDVGAVQCMTVPAFEARFWPTVVTVNHRQKPEGKWDGLL